MPTTTVSIPGIHCAACAALIQDVSSDFPDVQRVDVDLAAKRVALDHAVDFDLAAWKIAIEALGDTYAVRPVS